MVVSISLGISVGSPSRGLALEPPVAPLAVSATPAAFTRDTLIFDSGAARGDNTVTIPLPDITTDAPDGATIEARAVHADTRVSVYGWRAVGMATGGTLQGAVLAEPNNARRPHWLRVETRVQGSAAAPQQTPNRFGVGHVLVLWGQSEIANLFAAFYDGTTPDAVTADEMVVFHWHDRATPGSGLAGVRMHVVTDTTPYNTRLAKMANSLIAARPGEKFSVIVHAKSGAGFTDPLIDGAGNQVWSDDLALHRAATGGGDAGVVAFDWYAAPRTYGSAYGEVLHQIAFGKTVAGVSIGSTPVSIDGKFTADHLLTELYDWTETRVVVVEPHRFEPTNDINIAASRTSVRAMYDASAETALAGPGHPVLHYGNGRADGAGGWTDITHPSPGEGSERFGVGLVQSVLRAAGITGWQRPVIDNVYWEPSGTHVDLWSSAGPIVTNSGNPPVGVVVDGAHVAAAIVTDGGPSGNVTGALRVTASSSFTSTTTLDFAPVSTGLTDAADIPTGWNDYPLVDVGAPGMPDGVPLANAPYPAVLASTIAGGTGLFAVDGDDRYQATTKHGANTPYTMLIRFKPSVAGGTFVYTQNQVSIELLSSGVIRYTAPGVGLTSTAGGAYSVNAMNDFMFAYDPANGEVRVHCNGTLVGTHTVAPWTWQTNREWRILDAGAADGVTGDIEGFSLWEQYVSGATPPTGTPDKLIEGDQAGVVATATPAPKWYVVVDGSAIN